MTDLPFIALPAPNNVPRAGSDGAKFPRSQVRVPGRDRQRQRLGGRFTRLSQRLATPQGLAELRNDPGSIAPERAVVFELADLPDVKKVYRALAALGFELMDEDETTAVDADFPLMPTPAGRDRSDKPSVHRLYFAMPGEAQLRSLVALWERHEQRAEPWPRPDGMARSLRSSERHPPVGSGGPLQRGGARGLR